MKITRYAAAFAAALVLCGMPLVTASTAEAARVVKLSNENRVGKLRVVLGNSDTIRVDRVFSEIVVGDPETADVNPLSDQTFYVLGRKLGTTNVTLFDKENRLVAVIDIEVTHNLDGLQQAMREGVPGAKIRVRSINGRVLLEGLVPSAPAAAKAAAIANDFAPGMVTNSLTIAGNQQVNLEVRMIEVSRSAGKDLGINLNLTDKDGNGLKTTGTTSIIGSLPFGTLVANFLSNGASPDIIIRALEEKNLARRLAEPNLTALSGETASFHAGGEVPVCTVDTTQVAGEVTDRQCTVTYKEFGVKLDFTPVVLDNGLINMTVRPEVSEIDSSISVEGNPGFTTRKAKTSVELRDGQSFAIAGLLQTVNAKTAKQVPWLGDVPVLGTLFRSSSFQKKESDLVIIVTPRLARPVGTKQQLQDPLQNPISSNEPEQFLLGKLEVSRKDLDLLYRGQYGHIIDLPKVDYGAPQK